MSQTTTDTPRGRTKHLLYSFGDGDMEARLRELSKRRDLIGGLLVEDVEHAARDFADVIADLPVWDDDDARDVQNAALSFLQAIERFARNHIEAQR